MMSLKNTRRKTMTDNEALELLNVKELCEILNISRSTLERWLESTDFPQPKCIGTSKRWMRRDLENYLLSL
jgi:excisionase family DNA binding protein